MAVVPVDIHWQGYHQDVNERQSEYLKEFNGFQPRNNRGESGRDR